MYEFLGVQAVQRRDKEQPPLNDGLLYGERVWIGFLGSGVDVHQFLDIVCYLSCLLVHMVI